MAVKKKPGQGNQQPTDDDDEEPTSISDEMRTEITNLVNAAVSGQLSRKLPNAITGALEVGLAPLREQMENIARGGRRGSNDDDPDDEDDPDVQPVRGKRGGKGQQQQQARGKDPEVETMRKQLAKLTEERKQEVATARNRERDTLLREQLEAAGVDKNRVRGAVAVLRDSMKYDEKAGEWSYKAKRDGFDEDIDVSTGVGEWAATDEGKSYLAPPNGAGQQQPRGGSGVRPTGGAGGGQPRLQNGGRPTQDPKAAKVQAKQEAVQNLSKAIDSLGGGGISLG